MPIIHVKLIEGVFEKEQKRKLIGKLTDALEEVYPGLRDATFVTIEEVKEEQWGIGGQPMTAAMVEAHAKKNTGQA